MGKSGKVARRYAKALILAVAPSEMEQVRDQLNEFVKIWKSDEGLRLAILNPSLILDDKVAATSEIARRLIGGNQSFINLVSTLTLNGRVEQVEAIASEFARLIDELKSLLTLEITSAFEVSSAERSNIVETIGREFGGLASVSWQLDKNLLGGLKIKAGDLLMDSSVRGGLDRLRGELLGRSI